MPARAADGDTSIRLCPGGGIPVHILGSLSEPRERIARYRTRQREFAMVRHPFPGIEESIIMNEPGLTSHGDTGETPFLMDPEDAHANHQEAGHGVARRRRDRSARMQTAVARRKRRRGAGLRTVLGCAECAGGIGCTGPGRPLTPSAGARPRTGGCSRPQSGLLPATRPRRPPMGRHGRPVPGPWRMGHGTRTAPGLRASSLAGPTRRSGNAVCSHHRGSGSPAGPGYPRGPGRHAASVSGVWSATVGTRLRGGGRSG